MNHSHRDLDRLGELLLVRAAQQGHAETFRTLITAGFTTENIEQVILR